MLQQNNLQNNKGLSKATYSLENIASIIDGELIGNPNQLVSSLGSLQNASIDCISFVSSKKFESLISVCSAGAIIVKKDFKPSDNKNYILVKDPYYAFAILSKMFDPIEDMFEGIDLREREIKIIQKEKKIEKKTKVKKDNKKRQKKQEQNRRQKKEKKKKKKKNKE